MSRNAKAVYLLSGRLQSALCDGSSAPATPASMEAAMGAAIGRVDLRIRFASWLAKPRAT
jgi:hypothetical protein